MISSALPRRRLLTRAGAFGGVGLLSAAGIAAWPKPVEAAAPYPANRHFRLHRLDRPWLWRVACGSDQWPHIAVDGKTFVAGWGDGWGFRRPPAEEKSAIGFTRFSGPAAAPAITDLWADRQSGSVRSLSLKPQALLKVGNQIYVFAMGLADNRDRTRLFRMPLDGSTLTPVSTSVIRKSVEGLQVVGAVNRKPLSGGDIILLLARHGGLQSAELYVGAPKNPTVWAARARPETLGTSEAWEWFCGHDRSGNPIWSRARVRDRVFTTANGRTVVPVFRDPRGSGKHVMISRCPSLPGFVLAKTQNWLELGLFYGPTALGPWTTLFYGPFVPPGAAPDPRIFTAQVVIKWSYNRVVSVMWSGAPRPNACSDPASGNYDAVHLTRFAVEHL